MKDYYRVLGVPSHASQEDIKRAFRRLALEHHPDRNPGNEKQAEARFKEINEAYSVLGEPRRRRDYDYAMRSPFARAGAGGNRYAQESVFRDSFADPDFLRDLDRMFAEAGLRFDQDFVNSIFGGRGFVFHFYGGPGGGRWAAAPAGQGVEATAPRPSLGDRFLGWLVRSLLKRVLGVEPLPAKGRDLEARAVVTSAEAERGGEKEVSYRRGKVTKRLMVKVPAGVKHGTRIRLKGMGQEGQVPGDLYVVVKVRG